MKFQAYGLSAPNNRYASKIYLLYFSLKAKIYAECTFKVIRALYGILRKLIIILRFVCGKSALSHTV